MTIEPRTYETSIATLTRVRPDHVEIHYHPGIVFSNKAVAEVQEMRRKIMGRTPYSTLTIIPEDVDFELSTMQQDHTAADRTESQVVATAVVTSANMIEMLIKLYFSYYPQMQRILITDKEKEARAWLNTQMEEVARTGS
ncbi:MAG: hypothetical protein ABI599_07955 [Flavobacteriales bacterium]